MIISKNSLSKILNFRYSYLLVGGVLFFLLVASGLGALLPHLISNLAKNYPFDQQYIQAAIYLLVFFIVMFLNRICYELFVNQFIKYIVQHIRVICFDRWLLKYDTISEDKSSRELYPQGEVIARIMSDTESLRELITSGSFNIFIDLFFIISCLISFIAINLVAGLSIVFTIIISIIFLLYGSKYMRVIFHSVRKTRGIVSRMIANVVGGLSETYFTRHENYASKKGAILFNDFLVKQLKANFWDASYYSLAESLYPIMLLVVVIVFPYTGIREVAIILAIVDLIQRAIDPIKGVASKITNLQRAYTGFIRIHEFLVYLSTGFSSAIISSPKKKFSLKKFIFNCNDFSYSDHNRERFKIKNIKIEGEKGKLIGIVGISGSGKSTLLNILAANIIPKQITAYVSSEEGDEISYAGSNNEELLKYREAIGIISQDSHIFSETLAFNIAMTADIPNDFYIFWDWIIEKIIYLKTFGYGPSDLVVPTELSLGQKQLLSAIRACYLKKSIILFDEISSAMDSDLELALRDVIGIVQQNALTIIVTHRIETIIESDEIIVLERGEIAGRGVHKELIKTLPIYDTFISEITES